MTRALRTSIGGMIAAGVIVMHAPSQASGSGEGHALTPVAPQLLSETGLYAKNGVGGHLKRTADQEALVVDPRNRPFSPQYPLWSDGAHKQRWVYLPPGAPIDVTNVDAWTFPVGTKFWKEFTFNGRRVETRFLWRADDRGWVFASYKWNDAQTDAALAPAEGDIAVADIDGTKRHSIP